MKRNKIFLYSLLSLVLIIAVYLILNTTSNKSNEILIGAILPTTGDAAIYGKNCKQGIELAVSEINDSGGIDGVPIKVIFEDSQLQPSIAVSAFTKLTDVDNVLAIIGPLSSSNAMATAPISDSKKIISFSPGASTPKLTDAGPYVYRDWQSDALEAQVMAKYAIEHGWNNFAILFVNNDFGITLKDYFTRTVESKEGKILATESFEQNKTDFRIQLLKIKESNPDAIYLLSYPQQTPLIVNQMRSLGIKSQILGVAAIEDPSLLKLAGKNAEGMLYTIAIPLSDTISVREKFIKNYEKKFKEKPGLISDTGYDAMYILAEAIRNAQELTRESIKNSLDQIHKYEGASGFMTFDKNGDVIKPIGIKEVQNNEFIWVEK